MGKFGIVILITTPFILYISWFLIDTKDRSTGIQKLTIWRHGWLVFSIFTLSIVMIGWGFILFHFLKTDRSEFINTLWIVITTLLVIIILLMAGAAYMEYLLIRAARGKSVQRTKRGNFIYMDQMKITEFHTENVETMVFYVPSSIRSIFSSVFSEIKLKDGTIIRFNSLVCEPDFFEYELTGIEKKIERWKLLELPKLINEKTSYKGCY